ncbi:DUF3043 domain-containing protein [Saxibacter everestensis]|uniref:DUF3043 domain-containing protein n=1 Tax=Saxibacter everestensis TaxID=2909229 RepID=A0ABY8QYQ2_9MICO|nr:DUF3043 domain-containing protein [Brevibacteriaceae bacterium ZFBP1038]
MFGRKQTPPEAPGPAPEDQPAGPGVGKGRPTPKRRDQEAARKRPLVPNDRKEAARRSREQEREQRGKAREAMLSGDERYLPARDRGPQRRYVRDVVDARVSVGEFFMPMAIVVLLLGFIQEPAFRFYSQMALYVVVLLVIADATIIGFTLKSRLKKKFGTGEVERGVVFYGIMRSLQIRRLRLPKPMVKRGRLKDD